MDALLNLENSAVSGRGSHDPKRCQSAIEEKIS
jgi:hypothetical protein